MMKIICTEEQAKDLFEDAFAEITIGKYRIYFELDKDKKLEYIEFVKSYNGKTEQGYAFDRTELEKLIPKKMHDPSYYHNDPLCPSCGTHMIYNFECCPKCGQKIDYSKE